MAEQLGTGPFNRGALLNFAFLAAEAGTGTVAIVDVDMLPLPGVNFSDVGCGVACHRPSMATSPWPVCDRPNCSTVAGFECRAITCCTLF